MLHFCELGLKPGVEVVRLCVQETICTAHHMSSTKSVIMVCNSTQRD